MEYADFVVVGGGLSGAAVLWQLARRDLGRVVLIEMEQSLGIHASAQNAAMIRRLVENPHMAALARAGAAVLADPPTDLRQALERILGREPLVRTCGSILCAATEPGSAKIRTMLEAGREAGVEAQWIEPAEIARRVPGIEASSLSGGAWCAADGVGDPDALLQAFVGAARAKGASVLTGVQAVGAQCMADRLVAIDTNRGRIACGCAIDAGGAWAAGLARSLGAQALPLQPYRRHIVVTAPIAGTTDWPIVWDLERGFYARPESGRLVVSACDQEAWPPGVPTTNPEVLVGMAHKAAELFPSLAFPVARTWAGLRTFPPDEAFVLGPDPNLQGLYWAAGLGGHGVTCCAATGRLVADAVEGDSEQLRPFLPERLLKATR